MSFKRIMKKRLIWDIGLIVAAVVLLVIGKYYSNRIPPMALIFLSYSMTLLIWGTIRLRETLATLESMSESKKD